MFDPKVDRVLQEYQDRITKENTLWEALPKEEMIQREDEWLLAVGPDTGLFLNTLIKSAASETILELGSSYGFSTIYLAEAARATGGRVISLELQDYKVTYAQSKLEEAGLSDYVEFRVGDALSSLEAATETFDFVLVDIWKRFYVPSFELFYPKLAKGAWVVADNMLYPPEFLPEATAYRNKIKAAGTFDSVQLPIGSGLETSYYKG